MAHNLSTLPGQIVRETIMGLMSDSQALIDRIGRKVPVKGIQGTIPVLPSVNSLAREDLQGGIAEGAEAKPIDTFNSNLSYATLRYTGIAYLTDGAKIELDDFGVNSLEYYLSLCMMQVAAGINKDTDDVLKSTSLNIETAANNGAWSSSSSTPIRDIREARRASGYGDTIILGRDAAEFLMEHPDMIARLSNFSGGSLAQGELVDLLRRTFSGVTNVVIGSNLYNSATEGQSASLAYQFDGLAWVGHSDDLVIPEQTGEPQTATFREEPRDATGLRYTRRLCVKRPNQDKGSVITGVTA